MVDRKPDMSTKMAAAVANWLINAQFFLLPGICVLCRQPSGRQYDLCRHCAPTLPRVVAPCPCCGLPLPPGTEPGQRCGRCISATSAIARTVAPFAWTEPVSSLIHGFKYHQRLAGGRVLGDQLGHELSKRYRGEDLPELLLPVPLHPARLRERGYNQALLLARQLGKRLQIPVAPHGCVRVRQTPPQQGLSARERRSNLRGAFALTPAYHWPQLRRVALVDDVVTTMSTVSLLARLLHRASRGGIEIHVWALARA